MSRLQSLSPLVCQRFSSVTQSGGHVPKWPGGGVSGCSQCLQSSSSSVQTTPYSSTVWVWVIWARTHVRRTMDWVGQHRGAWLCEPLALLSARKTHNSEITSSRQACCIIGRLLQSHPQRHLFQSEKLLGYMSVSKSSLVTFRRKIWVWQN